MGEVKRRLGFDPAQSFVVPDEAKQYYAQVKQRGQQAEQEWNAMFAKYAAEFPQLAADLTRRINGKLPDNWLQKLPSYTPDQPAVATRCVVFISFVFKILIIGMMKINQFVESCRRMC